MPFAPQPRLNFGIRRAGSSTCLQRRSKLAVPRRFNRSPDDVAASDGQGLMALKTSLAAPGPLDLFPNEADRGPWTTAP